MSYDKEGYILVAKHTNNTNIVESTGVIGSPEYTENFTPPTAPYA